MHPRTGRLGASSAEARKILLISHAYPFQSATYAHSHVNNQCIIRVSHYLACEKHNKARDLDHLLTSFPAHSYVAKSSHARGERQG